MFISTFTFLHLHFKEQIVSLLSDKAFDCREVPTCFMANADARQVTLSHWAGDNYQHMVEIPFELHPFETGGYAKVGTAVCALVWRKELNPCC